MQRRILPRQDLQERLRMLRQALLRELLVRPVRHELLVYSVALDRDPVEPIGQVARVVLDRVVAVLDPADPGHIGHRVWIPLVPKKACARDRARMQRVRRWDRDLRGPRVKLAPKVIVRRDSSVDRVRIADRVRTVDPAPSVDRDRSVDRDLKAQLQEIVRRDPKVQEEIDRRDPKVVVASSEVRVLIVEDALIRVGRDPKGPQGRRMRGRRKVGLRFRRPNPQLRKQQSRQPRRLQNRLLRRRSLRRTS